MDKEISVDRTEKKYYISLWDIVKLKSKLKYFLKEDKYSLSSTGYKVRSVYFDSIDNLDYYSKIDGLNKRKKIRLRVYGHDLDFAKLEVKHKLGDKQRKVSLIIKKSDAENLLKGDYESLLTMGNESAKWIYSQFKSGLYKPRCMIEYDRYVLMHPTNKIRITIDSNIKYSNTEFNLFKKSPSLLPILHTPILEVKYNGFLLDPVRNVIKQFNLEECAISKYVMARKDVG